VVTVRVESPLTEVVGVMVDRGLRFVPVLDGPQLVGVITNGDLVQRAGLALRLELHESTQSVPDPTWAGGTARDVMTDEPTAVLAGTKITDVARLMLHRGIKRIPVLHQARVVGIVSRFDILRTVADDLTNGTAPAIPSGPVTVIGQLAQGRVPAVPVDAPLTRILDVLAGTRLNQAVVIDAERHVVGLVSDADLLRRVGPTHRGVVDRLMRRGGQVAPGLRQSLVIML
jgi:CBS domain-containing protein